MRRVFIIPYTQKCPANYMDDPPEEELMLPDVTVEYNPPDISYKEQEIPKTISLKPYTGLEHSYEYSKLDDGEYVDEEKNYEDIEDRD